MATLTSIDQSANDGDTVTAQWINSLKSRLTDIQGQIALVTQDLSNIKSQLSQAFRVTVATGLLVNVAGGSVKNVSSGVVYVVAPTQVLLSDNATQYIYVNQTGTITASTTRPSVGFEIASAVTASGAVSSINQYPIFEIKSGVDLSNYATVSYANSRSWSAIAYGRRSTIYNIPSTETFYPIPVETIQGSGLSTAGVFTAQTSRDHVFAVQVRVDTASVYTASLAVKISLFVKVVGGSWVEYGILQQGEAARGDITLNAENIQPVTLNAGDQMMAQVYISTGVNARIRENSQLKIWGLP